MTPADDSSPRARFRWLAAVCLLFAASCQLPPPKAEWREEHVVASSERVLWEVTILALEKTGFPIGAKLEPGKLVATSGWMISLAPFRGKGFREQCEIRYSPESEGEYKVEVRVRREKNEDLLHPLDLSYAEWVAEPDNPERAQIVLQYIRGLLGTSRPAATRSGAALSAGPKG
jgi:hypothetical protein